MDPRALKRTGSVLGQSQDIPAAAVKPQFTCDLCLEQEAKYACCEECLDELAAGAGAGAKAEAEVVDVDNAMSSDGEE